MVAEDSGEADNVKVAVRCRPLSQQEFVQGHISVVNIDRHIKTVTVSSANLSEPPKSYTFDELFDETTDQITVYNSIARPIVENVLRGYNGTIFAYGQTGTGKTYTMSGNSEIDEHKGIIPNSFAHIFDHIAKCKDDKTFLVRVSFMEIYNEEIRDLLQKPQKQKSLEIKERADIGVYVKDLMSVTVSSADQCLRIMQFGHANRHTGMTSMNEQSSRSHAIFTLTIECSERVADGRQLLTQGKLHLVDLAGSERQSKTNAVGERLKEASKINLSLSTLGNVISALVDSKCTHIPYRNSKLTRMLQDSLGGNSKTLMIANIGPASYNYDETISTLRYANRAKNIKNVAKINEDPKDALLRKFQEEIELLKKQLEEAELSGDSDADDEETLKPIDGVQQSHGDKKLLAANAHYAERIREMEESIERGKKLLQEEHGMKEVERRRLAEDLMRKEKELRESKRAREQLTQKLAAIERKLIVGGENMLEKAETQARLLEESNRELERARQNELALQQRLLTQQAEQLDIEEKYNSLHDEAQGLTRRLKKVWAQYSQAKAELRDMDGEHQREMEALLENIRQLQKENLFATMVINSYIPEDQLRFIEKHMSWNDEIGDWQLKCIAYTGNNLRENKNDYSNTFKYADPQMKPIHLSYADVLGENVSVPSTATSRSSVAGFDDDNIAPAPNFRPKSAMRDRNAARIRALLN